MTGSHQRSGPVRGLSAAALLGAATGARSFTGLAAVVIAARPGATGQPAHVLGDPRAKVVAGLAAATEYALDKLAAAPARTQLPGLVSRLGGAACSAVLLTRSADRVDGPLRSAAPVGQTALAAGLAVGAAATTAWLGLRWRHWAAQRFGTDVIGALIEDVLALGAATSGVLVSGRTSRPNQRWFATAANLVTIGRRDR